MTDDELIQLMLEDHEILDPEFGSTKAESP